MFRIARNVQNVSPSKTLAITAQVNEMKARGEDVIGFGAGEPDFPTPEYIKDAAKKSLDDNFTRYTPTMGILPLREAISEKLLKDNSIDYDPKKEIIVTGGAKMALYEAIAAVTERGDDILIPDPYWVSYPAMVALAGGNCVYVPTEFEQGFEIKPEAVESSITPNSKAIIINSPNNPTGAVISKKAIKEIADIAIDNDLLVISDEIYEHIIYDKKHFSIGSLNGMKENTITVNGFSKSYSMTGWRLGYAAGPANIIREMDKIQAHSISSPTSFVQTAGITALKGDPGIITKMVDEFKNRRDFLVKRVDEIEGLDMRKPDGAFYAFINFADSELGKKCGGSSEDFSKKTLEKAKVAFIPGSEFGKMGEGFVRMSYATSMKNIDEGLKRVEKIIG